MSKKSLLCFLLALSMLFSLAACGKKAPDADSPEARRANGELAVGIAQDLDDSLDPHKSVAAGTKEVMFNVYEGLVKPTADAEFVGAVADRWDVSNDQLTYTFHLREGIKFSNGEPVTPEDAVFSILRCRDEELVPALAIVDDVKADGENVVLTLSAPSTELLSYLTLAIVPEAHLAELDTATYGTGPYTLVSRTAQSGFVLVRNDNYWGAAPALGKITFRVIENADALVLSLKSGAIDLCSHMTSTQVSQLGDFDILEGSMNLVQAIYLNHAVAPLDNELVRKALCYALDRQQVFDMLADGHGTALGSSIYPQFRKYFLPELAELYPHDVEKAKALLAEAGYPNGFDLTIKAPSNYQPHMDTAQIVAEQFRAIGVNVTIEPIEWASWLSDVYTNRDFEATIIGFDASTLTARAMLERFTSDAHRNMINFNNADYDAAFARALAAKTDEEQTEAYLEMETILAETAANVYIQDLCDLVAARKGLTGYQFYPLYVMDLATLSWS